MDFALHELWLVLEENRGYLFKGLLSVVVWYVWIQSDVSYRVKQACSDIIQLHGEFLSLQEHCASFCYSSVIYCTIYVHYLSVDRQLLY